MLKINKVNQLIYKDLESDNLLSECDVYFTNGYILHIPGSVEETTKIKEFFESNSNKEIESLNINSNNKFTVENISLSQELSE